MSERLTTPVVTEALRHAIQSRNPDTGQLLHHSDRGCQYTSDAFQRILKTMNMMFYLNQDLTNGKLITEGFYYKYGMEYLLEKKDF